MQAYGVHPLYSTQHTELQQVVCMMYIGCSGPAHAPCAFLPLCLTLMGCQGADPWSDPRVTFNKMHHKSLTKGIVTLQMNCKHLYIDSIHASISRCMSVVTFNYLAVPCAVLTRPVTRPVTHHKCCVSQARTQSFTAIHTEGLYII